MLSDLSGSIFATDVLAGAAVAAEGMFWAETHGVTVSPMRLRQHPFVPRIAMVVFADPRKTAGRPEVVVVCRPLVSGAECECCLSLRCLSYKVR
ncbi:hypothetical protein E2C01_027499 [Portunus trituberculatus]|uniref:Uncharacterized protein n=1 Tax=Portunus trituberculatus TaxID=210409 RepID=A0A5B7EI02_PORTR|nr:hypothetical protein [Portunus trituberculatus]